MPCMCVRVLCLFLIFLPMPSVWLNYGDESRYFRFPSTCPYGLTAWLGFFLMWVSLDLWKAQTSVHFLLPLPPGSPLLHHTTTHLFLYLYIICTGLTRHFASLRIDTRDSRSVDIFPQYRVTQFALINFLFEGLKGYSQVTSAVCAFIFWQCYTVFCFVFVFIYWRQFSLWWT